MDVALNLAYYAPTTPGALYASLWGAWYESRGEAGEKPPEVALQQLALFDEVRETVGGADQKELLDEILRLATEQFYVTGTARELQKYIARGRVGPSPEGGRGRAVPTLVG